MINLPTIPSVLTQRIAVMAKKETKIVRGIGDNSSDNPVDGTKILGFINQLEKVQAKIDQQLQEKREVYADAKAVGYDNKTIRKIIAERKMEPEKRKEQAELLTLYKSAIGMTDEEE